MSRKTNYHESAFWEERYKQNICEWYEWLATPNQLTSHLQHYLPSSSSILELGCGSSNFAEKLISLKHQSVTCLDFSKEVIKSKQKHSKEGTTYKVHDILQPLPFEEGSFDAIVEKNTLDCLFCFEDFPAKIMRVMKQCYRILKQGGVMLSFSHGKEKVRRFFYRNRFAPFNLEVVPVHISSEDLKSAAPQIYLYVLIKGQGGNYPRGQYIKEQEDQFECQKYQLQQQPEHEEAEQVDQPNEDPQEPTESNVKQEAAEQDQPDNGTTSHKEEENQGQKQALQEQEQDYEFDGDEG